MSIAEREAKYMMRSLTCAGHELLVHFTAASPGSLTAVEPQTGHVSGSLNGSVPSGRFSYSTRTTSGIISPALRTQTKSPTRTSFLSISSWLCSPARRTIVPARRIGSKTAVGVKTPVRPTVTSILCICVSFSSGGNLKAIAHLGAFAVTPSSGRSEMSLSFTTTPSVSIGCSKRPVSHLSR